MYVFHIIAGSAPITDIASQLDITDVSASGIVVVIIWLILTGKLIPISTHKITTDALEYFKSAHDEERQLRMQLSEAINELSKREDVAIKMGKGLIENVPIPVESSDLEDDNDDVNGGKNDRGGK